MRRLSVLVSVLALAAVRVAGTAAVAAQEATPPAALPPLVAEFGAGWSSGDPERVVALYTEDSIFEEVVLGGVVTRSHDELRAYAAALFAAFPDLTLTPTAGFAAGDRVAAEWVVTGTYAGRFGDLPAGTGQRVEFRMATIWELADGRIRGERDYWDAATLLAQIGVLPGAATPTA